MLQRAESAETESRRALVGSKILQTRMTRQSRREGQRKGSLQILDSAIALLPKLEGKDNFRRDLRNELAAALAVREVESERWQPFADCTWEGVEPSSDDVMSVVFGSRRVSLKSGSMSIRIDERRTGESFPEPVIASSELPLSPMAAVDSSGRSLAAIGRATGADSVYCLLIWDLQQTAKPTSTTELVDTLPVAVVYNHQDDNFVVVGTNKFTLFDRQGEFVRTVSAGGDVVGCCMHPTEPVIAVWDDCGLRLVDLSESSPIQMTQSHATYEILSADWHPDGSMLAIGSADHFAYTFYAGELDQPAMIFGGAQGWVNHVAFAADGTLMTSSEREQRTRLYDTNTGQLILAFEGAGVRFDPSTDQIEGTKLGSPTRWQVSKPSVNWTLDEDRNTNVASNGDVDRDGRMILCGWDNIFLWDFNSRRSLAHAKTQLPTEAKFVSEQQILVIATNAIRGFRVTASDGLLRLEPNGLDHPIPTGWTAEILASQSPPLVSIVGEGTANLFEVDDQQLILRSNITLPPIQAARTSPDGRLVAAVFESDKTIGFYDTNSGRLVNQLSTSGPSPQVFFDPAGSRVLIADGAGYRLLDAMTFETMSEFSFDRPSGHKTRASFQPGGKFVAVSHRRDVIDLVDLDRGESVLALPQPQNGTWLQFTPDGNSLLSRNANYQLSVWDLARLRSQCAARNLDWQ